MALDFLQETSFVEMERQAFISIQRIFPCEKELLDSVPVDEIVSFFQKDLEPTDCPFLIRVAGQSGSGKSSQIVPALQEALQKQKYIQINVGMFARFHPKYELWQKTDPAQMRENTNGFALRALVLFYRYCIFHKINVLLDMTLLEPEIDMYLMLLAKKMGYQIQVHLLCVPKRVSDSFIRLRQKQTGRCVRISSSTYFFTALARCLKALTCSGQFSKHDRLILWTHDLARPLRQTNLANHTATRILQKYQGRHFRMKRPKILLNVKKKWMKLFLELLNV